MLAITGAIGCAEIGGMTAPTVPAIRLADLDATRRSLPEPPVATIGDVSHYVLGDSDRESLTVRDTSVTREANGRGVVTLACPGASSRRGDEITVKTVWIDQHDPTRIGKSLQSVPDTCKGGDEIDVVLHGLPTDPETKVVVASADRFLVPPRRVLSPHITIPHHAELRVVVGVRPVGTPPSRVVHLTIHATDPTGRATLVDERRLQPAEVGGWVEWRVRLDQVHAELGANLAFTFESERVASNTGAVHVLWGDPTVFAPRLEPRTAEHRNVVLISLDTLRADHVGHLGYPDALTPNLDRLASEGVTFVQTISQANWTLPAHGSMLTGTYPCTHGLGTGANASRLPVGVSPLAEHLRRAGYVTGAFTENAYVTVAAFQRGFDVFVGETRMDANETPGVIDETFDAARRFIHEHRAREFFAFVHTYQVHAPYDPPGAFSDLAQRDPLPTPDGSLPASDDARVDAGKYAAEVAYTDQMVGSLLESLKSLDLADRTIVIVTSDHGEAFGEHGIRYHATGVHREITRVPLIVRVPGKGPTGRRIEALTGLVDITPTVLSLLRLPVPPWMQGIDLSGTVLGSPTDGPPARRVLPISSATGNAYRGPDWMLTGSHFYDLANDPLEQAPRRPTAAERRRAQLPIFAECRGSARLLAETGRTRGHGARTPRAEQANKLRALGYVE